ncbi:alkaline phosphatase family protein [Bacillus sp. JJ1609]|uniref:alkaline phosphatase family protein n=1 Tax=Bacillus sp. JJ1609 TaxID=3122977 RepID=UPI002FFEAC5F
MTTRILTALIIMTLLLSNTSESSALAKSNHQVILISFDGMRNDLTRRYMKDGKLPNIEKVVKKGAMAKYATTVSPSLTAPSHAAIATGAPPIKTSIVSNVWQEPDKALTNKQDAFMSELDVNPLWVEAKKQGKTTATVAFAGANPKTGKQGDYTVYYGDTWAPSKEEKLKFTQAANWKNTPQSYSPLMESSFQIKVKDGKDQTLHVLGYDSSNDQRVNYNQFIISESKELETDTKGVKSEGWGSFSLKVQDKQVAGFWFRFAPRDQRLQNEIKMYRTAVTSGEIDGPEGFTEGIREKFGVFPAQDDDIALQKGWISRKEYEEIAERFVNWVTDVSLYIKEEYDPDLLMFYAPQIDHQEHLYLLTDPRQPGYTPEKSQRYMKNIEWAYKVADEVVGETTKSLEDNENLFIVSDHGMEPAHSLLEPNKVLKNKGLLVETSDAKVDMKKSKAIAIPSGSAAHIYINLKSREKYGVVPQGEYEQVREEIINAFKEVKVERNVKGKVVKHHLTEMWTSIWNEGLSLVSLEENTKDLYSHVFQTNSYPYQDVKRLTEKGKPNMEDNHAGDVLLMAAPGYIMGNGMSKAVKPAIDLGTHGGDPEREKLKAVFIAMGPDISNQEKIKPISNLDIAPTVYELLGLETPKFVEGKSIEELTEK